MKRIKIQEIRNLIADRWNEKPCEWGTMIINSPAHDVEWKEISSFIGDLPVKRISDLYDYFPVNPVVDFNHPTSDVVFILDLPGERWLVNTEGYNYIRYAVRLV